MSGSSVGGTLYLVHVSQSYTLYNYRYDVYEQIKSR